MKADNGLYVNLYNDCKFKSVMRGESVTLEMRANPYKADGARIKICGRGEKFALALRVPTWAEGFAVRVNSEAYEGVERDGYLFIERVWQDSDTVEISFRAPVKMRVINGKIAFTRGAITLARDKRLDDIESPLNVIAKDGKTVRAKRVKNTVFNANLTLQLKTRDGKITLCDYAQTGKNYDDDNTGMTVWQNV
jgi:DUF1680 family protein